MTGARFAAMVSRTACLGFLFISTLDAAVAAVPDDKETAGDCLKSPKGAAPPGERWRYRVERGSKRHCWYTRADGPRKAVAQRPPTAKPDTLDAAPLQLSVANARAEADLSAAPPPAAEPRDIQPIIETRNPAWTLADRWSQNADASPAVQAPSTPLKPPTILTPDAVEVAERDDSLIELAAGTVALLGLSVVLIATLMRRRKRASTIRDWPLARRDMDDESNAPLTDLNDEPLMTWRKTPKERLQTMRRTAELRDATSARIVRPNPTDFAGPRRRPTIPPGARA